MLISQEAVRTVRLKNSKPFDLEPYIGIKLLVHLGETPITHQVQLATLVSESTELLALKPSDEASAIVGVARYFDRALPVLGASLLDQRGDPLPAEEVAQLFSLLPAGKKGIELLQQMVMALLERFRGAKAEGASGE